VCAVTDDSPLPAMPFAETLGIEFDSVDATQVRAHLAWSERLCTTSGVLHGGALMGLADSLGGLCAFLNLPPGAQTATMSSSTVFLRGVRGGVVSAVCRPLHTGRTVIVVQTDLLDDTGRLAAQVTQTQAVLGGTR
jgi:uncharacterized protein (TIGR00369 family)